MNSEFDADFASPTYVYEPSRRSMTRSHDATVAMQLLQRSRRRRVQCLWQAVQIRVQWTSERETRAKINSPGVLSIQGRMSCTQLPARDVSESRSMASHRSDDLDIALNPGCPVRSRVVSVSSSLKIRDAPLGGLNPES